jgi:AraC-like DNA-binding protein
VPSTYRERAPRAAPPDHVACLWYQRVAPADAPDLHRIVPDGCMDIIWLDGGLHVAGPDTEAMLASLTPATTVVGLRFLPGHGPAFLGIDPSEHVNGRVELDELWGADARRLTEQIGNAPDVAAATDALERAVAARAAAGDRTDPIADAATQLLGAPDGGARVREVAPELGLSARQLHRRCLRTFGYGPKTLARVLRFQRFLRVARSAPSLTYARLAAECGYTDEAHLSRDCRALGGATPGELARRRSRTGRAEGPGA